jgi:hypothetical protein
MKNQKLIPKFQSSHVRNGRLIGVFCKRTVFIKGKNSVGNCRLLVVLRNGIQGESFYVWNGRLSWYCVSRNGI